MFSSYFQYISLIQYAQKYIILVGAQTTEAVTTKRKVFHSSVTTLVLHSRNCTVPIYTLTQMTKKIYKLTEGKYHGL